MNLTEDIRRLLGDAREALAKLNRWPTGAPGGKGGQFAPKNTAGGGSAPAPRTRSRAQSGGPKAPNFTQALIQDTNTNAASHNAKVKLIEAAHASGDVNAILRQKFGTNTYAKKQVKLANEALEHLGSPHRVAAGQGRDTHAGLKGDAPTTAAPAAPLKPPETAVEPPKPPEPAQSPKSIYEAGITKLASDAVMMEGDAKAFIGMLLQRTSDLQNQVILAGGNASTVDLPKMPKGDSATVRLYLKSTSRQIGYSDTEASREYIAYNIRKTIAYAKDQKNSPEKRAFAVDAIGWQLQAMVKRGLVAQAPEAAPSATSAPAVQPATTGPIAYKQASTIAEAKAQLGQFGVSVRTTSEMVNPKAGALQMAVYGKLKVKGAQADDTFLSVLNTAGKEAERLHAQYPGILQGVVLEQRNPGPKARGVYRYLLGGEKFGRISMHAAESKMMDGSTWKNPFGMPYTVGNGEAGGNAVRAANTFRHEVGHALDYKASKQIRSELSKLTFPNPADGVAEPLLKWARQNVSEYASESTTECLAECFALYTSPSYTPGRLPASVETLMDRLAKRNITKARAEDDEEEFISISPIAPPDGYEMIPTEDDAPVNLTTLRFRSPEGEVLTYDDLFELGIIPTDEDAIDGF